MSTAFAIKHALPLPFSDGMEAFHRAVEFIDGKMNVVHYLFMKHGEHFHAGIYALLYADIMFLHGQQWLLMAVGIASTIGLFIFIVYLIQRTGLPERTTLALILFAALLLSSLHNAETWVFAFQAVLTSFRLWLLLTIWLYATGLENASRVRILGGLKCAFTGLFLHGGGILLPLLLTCIALLQRKWKWVLPPLLLYVPFVLVSQWSDQFNPAAGFGALVGIILQQPLDLTLTWLVKGSLTYIGFGLFPTYEYSLFIGVAGMMLLLTLWRTFITKQDAVQSIFSALVVFALISALLASLMIVSRIATLPNTFLNIYSSRYVANSSLFWIALAVLVAQAFQARRRLVLSMGAILLAVALVNPIVGYRDAVRGLSGLKAPLEKASAEAKLGSLTKETYIFLMQPGREDAHIDRVLAYSKARAKSIFHQ